LAPSSASNRSAPDDALAASISQESAEGSCMSDHAAESVVVSSRPAEVWFARHVMLSWGRASRRRAMAESFVVRREIQVAAPAATIVAFLTDPEKIIRWMGSDATMEPHPGGLYLLKVNERGSFREVVPVHRLAYSFGWDGDADV